MDKVYKFTSNDIEFLFTLNQPILTEQQDGESSPHISCSIYRSDQPDQVWKWEGHLAPLPQRQQIDLEYQDQINFAGEFWLHHDQGSGQNFIFMDARYGERRQHHFEGIVFPIDA